MVREGRIQKTPKGTRLFIGAGEEADIYYYLDGLMKDKVGRVPKGSEHFEPNTEKNALLRYRRHQIAYLMFPQYNLNVVGVDLSDRELFSFQVVRSKENLKDATGKGVSMRDTRAKREPPKEAEGPLNEMMKAGVVVHSGIVNVSVTPSEVKFFEVDGIVPDAARRHLTKHEYPPTTVKKGLLLVDALEFEQSLPDLDLDTLLREPQERAGMLAKSGKQHLEELYSQEIGSSIRVEKAI